MWTNMHRVSLITDRGDLCWTFLATIVNTRQLLCTEKRWNTLLCISVVTQRKQRRLRFATRMTSQWSLQRSFQLQAAPSTDSNWKESFVDPNRNASSCKLEEKKLRPWSSTKLRLLTFFLCTGSRGRISRQQSCSTWLYKLLLRPFKSSLRQLSASYYWQITNNK